MYALQPYSHYNNNVTIIIYAESNVSSQLFPVHFCNDSFIIYRLSACKSYGQENNDSQHVLVEYSVLWHSKVAIRINFSGFWLTQCQAAQRTKKTDLHFIHDIPFILAYLSWYKTYNP